MDLPVPDFALRPYARLPPHHRGRPVVSSTVDAFGRAHWLLRDRVRDGPYDALVVTVEVGGGSYETALGEVRAQAGVIDALPDGGFVVADTRCRRRQDHAQVFDPSGRQTHSLRLGDEIGHFLADEEGTLWVGYCYEGVYGEDELSRAGLRRFSTTGSSLWACTPVSDTRDVSDCYALNVSGSTAWASPYTDFALLEVCPGRPPRPRANPVRGADALAVHGAHVALFGGYGDDRDRLVVGTLTWDEVRPVSTGTLTCADGGPIGSRRVVSRGHLIYVQTRPFTEWSVFDLSEV